MLKIDTIILAAGASKRLGFNKLCVRVNGKAVVRRTVEIFLESRVAGEITVITGFERERVEHELAGLPVRFVHNPRYEEGMSSSVKAVLPYLKNAGLAFFHLGDKAFIDPGTIHVVLDSWKKDNRGIVLPVHKEMKGHPVLIDIQTYLPEMSAVEGDHGLRDVVEAHMKETLFVEAGEGVLLDLNTEEDIRFLERRGYTIEKG